jgi:hypothetical protein
MNKVLVYTVIAILLGTVTMVVPLAVLESNDPIVRNDDLINEIESTGAETQERSDMLAAPEPAPAAKPEEEYSQTDSETFDKSPEEPVEPTVATWGEADVASSLSSIGLIVIPSFVIALGVFVLLKKRSF